MELEAAPRDRAKQDRGLKPADLVDVNNDVNNDVVSGTPDPGKMRKGGNNRAVTPQHSHKEIEESYISVAGAWSENDAAVHAPGSLVFNPPGLEHRITTGELTPCLLAYAWMGAEERLNQPGMKFSSPRKA